MHVYVCTFVLRARADLVRDISWFVVFRMLVLIPLSAVCVRVCVRERVTRGKITPLFACSSSPGATSRKCVFLFLMVIGLGCPTQFLAYGLAPQFVVHHLWFPTLLDEESRRITDQVQQHVAVLAIPRFWQRLSYNLLRPAAHRFSVDHSGW